MKTLNIFLSGIMLMTLFAFGACQKDPVTPDPVVEPEPEPEPDPEPVVPDEAYIKLSTESLTFLNAGESATVTVESNYDWDYSYDSDVSWIDIARQDSVLTVTVTEDNDGDMRECVVTLTADGGEDNVAEAAFTISQSNANLSALVFEYTIPSSNTVVKLPFSGTVDCTVDWGDGNVESVASTYPTHTYSSMGIYNVSVTGTVTALESGNFASSSKPVTTLTAVKQWGKTGLTSLENAFYYNTYLETIPDDTIGSFADVETFNWAFDRATALSEIPAGLLKYATKVNDFEQIFAYTAITEIPEGLFDNNTEVETAQAAFYGCSSLKIIPGALFANMPKLETLYGVFGYCTSLTSIPSDIFKNCSSVTSMGSVFTNCTNLKSIPEGLFDDCEEATTFMGAFTYTAVTSIPAGLFDNCKKANIFDTCFQCCKIAEIPEGLFDYNTEATSFGMTFNQYETSTLKSIPAGLFDNCPKVTSFYGTFQYCAIESIPAGLFDNCPEVTNFMQVFDCCDQLETIPSGLFANCSKVEKFQYGFEGCTNLQAIPAGLFDSCTEVTSFQDIFNGCPYITEIPDGLFKNNTKVTVFANAFIGLNNLTEIPKGLFDNCPSAMNFNDVFENCSSLKSIPENLFANNKGIKFVTYAFSGCKSLTGESAYDLLDINGNQVMVHLYERLDDAYSSYYDDVTISSTKCYSNCTGLSDYYSIPSGWGGGATTSSLSSYSGNDGTVEKILTSN